MERFLDYFVPSHYDLSISLNREKTAFSATAVIDGTAKSESIKLHSVGLDLKQVFVDDHEVSSYLVEKDFVQIDGLGLGAHQLKFIYSAAIDTNMQGVYRSSYQHEGRERLIVATQFESHYARECFPCVDEPAAKATFSLQLHSDDPNDTLLANLPALSTVKNAQGVSVSFEKTPKMSTYLLAFAAGDFIEYSLSSKHGVVVRAFAGVHQSTADLKLAAKFAADVLDFYDDLFETPFPLPKLDLLALPDFESGAMENWGLTTYREVALLANERSSLDQKLYVCLVIAHELSHMWFGDLVTMQWWDDLWLNESFANMIEIYATAKLRPELSAWDYFYGSTVPLALQRDCLSGVQPVKVAVENVEDIANLFDGAIVYSKGSRLLLMLMRAMGEKNFFAGLADYFHKHAYDNTVSDDLWAALQPHADFDIESFMTPWLVQPGYPVLTGADQQRFLLSGKDADFKYPIRGLSDDLSGHYLINLDENALEEKLTKLSSLSAEQKLRIIIDRGLLAKTKHATSASLLPLLSAFKNETSSIIWDALARLVSQLKIFFDLGTPELGRFRRFVFELASPSLKRLGFSARPEDTPDDTRLRPTILALMTYSEDVDFLQAIEKRFANLAPGQLDANLRCPILSALIKNQPARANEYFDLYKESPDAALRQDLSSVIAQVPDREVALGLIPHLDDGNIRIQDRLGFFIQLVYNLYIKKDAIAWLYANWDKLATEEGDKTIADYPRYLAGCITREDDAASFRAFFEPRANEAILSRTLNIAFPEIDARLALVARDRAALFAALSA